MKLSFLGAAETVTGSKYLLQIHEKNYLIDCGLFQGRKDLRLKNREPFPIDPKAINGVILTHAHLDHSGYLPLLVKGGFRGKIYSSPATKDLSELLLKDAGRIQEEDAKRANRYGYTRHRPALPLYTEQEAEYALQYFHSVLFERPYVLAEDLRFTLFPSGHILGSSFIAIETKTPKINLLFSGDVGRPQDPLMKAPIEIYSTDYLVLESTYGDRLHPKVDILLRLEEIITGAIQKGGSVIIPAFAIGRAQTVLYLLYQLKQAHRIPPSLPIYLDSPMAQDATDLLLRYVGEHHLPEEECARVCSLAHYVRSQEESKMLNLNSNPSIIISASGMAEAGRVLHHLVHFAPEEKNVILFVGFQAEGTRGDRMLKGEKEIKIHGQMVPIRAKIENLDLLSSHADYEELLEWLKNFQTPPKEVFLTHGEVNASEALKRKIEDRFHWKVEVPHYLQTFELF